jgi:hypothetical protein
LSSFALIIIAIGLFPNLILEKIIVPAAEMLKYEGYAMDHLYHFHFFEWHPLQAMIVVSVLALVIYLPGVYRRWFDWTPPPWFSIYALLYKPLTHYLMSLTCRAGVAVDSSIDNAYNRTGTIARGWCSFIGDFDQGLDRFYLKWGDVGRKMADRSRDMDTRLDQFYQKSGEAARKIADKSADMDHALDNAYTETGKAAQKLAKQSTDIDRALNVAYDQAGQKAKKEMERRIAAKSQKDRSTDPSRWTTKNLSFDNLLLVLVLGIVLLIIFYFGRS